MFSSGVPIQSVMIPVPGTNNWHNIQWIEQTPQYLKMKARYKHIESQIDKKEREILTNPTNPRLHKAAKAHLKGKYTARVTGNLRILYPKEPDKIVLEKIGTHDEIYKK